MLHRDLKPANVLFTKSGAVRIADLGVSTCLQASRPLTENAAGTIPFMAPEVRKFLLGSKVAYSGENLYVWLGVLPAELKLQGRYFAIAEPPSALCDRMTVENG